MVQEIAVKIAGFPTSKV